MPAKAPLLINSLVPPLVSVHVSVYVVVDEGETVWVPLRALLPLQPPEAVHEDMLTVDQKSVELLPGEIASGLATTLT